MESYLKKPFLMLIKCSKRKILFFTFLIKFQIMKYYFSMKKEIDLLVNFSETEGIPYTFMEAFSSSVPVIAPNVGGIPKSYQIVMDF